MKLTRHKKTVLRGILFLTFVMLLSNLDSKDSDGIEELTKKAFRKNPTNPAENPRTRKYLTFTTIFFMVLMALYMYYFIFNPVMQPKP